MLKKLLSYMLVTAILSISLPSFSVGAEGENEGVEEAVINAFDTSFVYYQKNDEVYKDSMTLMIDKRYVSGRENDGYPWERCGFARYDLKEYADIIKYYDSAQLRIFTYNDSTDTTPLMEVSTYALNGNLDNYDSTGITFNTAKEMGLIDFGDSDSLMYTWEGGTLARSKTFYSGDILPMIVEHLENDSEDTVFAVKYDSDYNGYMQFYGNGTSDETKKPALILKISDEKKKFIEAGNKIKTMLGSKITDDMDFPSEINGVGLTWSSNNTDLISDDGEINEENRLSFSSGENSMAVSFDVEFSLNGIYLTDTFEFEILKKGMYAAAVEDSGKTKRELSFNTTTQANDVHGYIMTIPNSGFMPETEYRLIPIDESGSDKECIKFKIASDERYTYIDVTEHIQTGSFTDFRIETSGNMQPLDEQIILTGVDDDTKTFYDLVNKVSDEYLKDIHNITDDLLLPDEVDGTDITWTSDNEYVISNKGRVERPYSDGKDAVIKLTAQFDIDGTFWSYSYVVTVKKRGGEYDGYEAFKDPYHLSDESFFGVWDSENEVWSTEPIFKYANMTDADKSQRAIELAKQGSYDGIKEILYEYYRTRTGTASYEISPKNEYDIYADAISEKITGFYQMDDLRGVVNIDSEEWKEYTIEVTRLRSTYLLIDSDMNGSSVEIMSKEGDPTKQASLEVVIAGQKKSFPLIADTYISAGDNKDTNYGGESILLVREEAGNSTTPFGTNTARSYFCFDTGSTQAVESIQFKFYARSTCGNKKLFLASTQNEDNFDENTLKWSDHFPQLMNFKDTGYIWYESGQPTEATQKWGVEFEWIHAVTRLVETRYAMRRYVATNNEKYAYGALELMMSMYEQKANGDYPRMLDSGWRSEYILDIFFGTLKSKHATPELITAELKYIYQHAHDLKDLVSPTTNWNSAVRTGFIRICSYFPELSQEGWWEHAKQRLYELYGDVMLNADGSYTEGCSNYISGVLEEIKENIELIGAIDGEDDSYYEFFAQYYDKLARYYFDMTMNYGMTTPFGDGGRNDIKGFAKSSNEFRTNANFEFFATNGKKGKEPDYTSKLYPSKKIAFMRSNWTPQGMSATINVDFGGTHSHYDDMALDVYAYGKPLLIDTGISSYSVGTQMIDTMRRTIAHNTIEIDGLSQHKEMLSNHPEYSKLNLATNKLFDFADTGSAYVYTGFDVNRKVLFLHNSFWIVSDWITAPNDGIGHDYVQAWHPDAFSGIQIDEQTKTASTNFTGSANIQIVPADPEKIEAKLDKMYKYPSMVVGETLSDYLRIESNNKKGDQTFDTILYPDEQGKKTDVRVSRIPLDVEPITATALDIAIDNNRAVYYSSNETVPTERSFSEYISDGEMAYIEAKSNGDIKKIALTKTNMLKKDGKTLVECGGISDFGVLFEGKTVNLYSSQKTIPTVKVYYGKDVNTVVFNGEEVEFTLSDGYITTSGVVIPENTGTSTLIPGAPNVGDGGGGGGAWGFEDKSTHEKPDTPKDIEKNDGNNTAFEDTAGHWAEGEIKEMASLGIINGLDDGRFEPDRSVSRAEFIAMLLRALDIPEEIEYNGEFSDVKEDAWYAKYLSSAFKAGLISGYEDNSFRPDMSVSRQEMAQMMSLACSFKGVEIKTADISTFSDYDDIPHWSYEAVSRMVGAGLMQGMTDNEFSAHGKATRAQSAVVMKRLLDIFNHDITDVERK